MLCHASKLSNFHKISSNSLVYGEMSAMLVVAGPALNQADCARFFVSRGNTKNPHHLLVKTRPQAWHENLLLLRVSANTLCRTFLSSFRGLRNRSGALSLPPTP